MKNAKLVRAFKAVCGMLYADDVGVVARHNHREAFEKGVLVGVTRQGGDHEHAS